MEKFADWWCELLTFSECAGLETGERIILAVLCAVVGLAGMAVTVSLITFVAEIRHNGR
jgi:hypothetical protein